MSYAPYPRTQTERKVMDILRANLKGLTAHEFHTLHRVLRAQAALQAMGDRGLLLTTVRTAGNEVRFALRGGMETSPHIRGDQPDAFSAALVAVVTSPHIRGDQPLR